MYRKQFKYILNDLQKKIVFLVGPRQVGKTWLALEIGKEFSNTTYLNYDHFEDREIIKNASWLPKTELLIFDELHKMPNWQQYLKGIYDTKPAHLKILVTGGARLDMLRQTGDSLAGRYFRHRLLPFSMAELKTEALGEQLDRFIERGGFPEPFLTESEIDARRWRNQYVEGMLRYDVFDIEQIYDFNTLHTIYEILRHRVGSPASFASIARDVGISPTTVKKYIYALEGLYIIFRITPYSKNIGRSILKEPKIYFFDTGLVVGDSGAKLENFVAVSLLKHVVAKYDIEGEVWALHYLRTKDHKEVDFCLVKDEAVNEIIEVKTGDAHLSKNLLYFAQKYNLSASQVVWNLRLERIEHAIHIRNAVNYLKELFL